MMYNHWGWGIMWFGWIFWLVLAIVLIWLVWRISSDPRLRYGKGTSLETPLDILKKRYAKGEISKEDFERMKNDLKD